MKNLIERREFAFAVVGAINLAVGLSVFAILLHTIGQHVHYLIVLIITYALSITSAFVLHRRFVYKVRHKVLTDFVRFCLVQSAAMALNAGVLPLLVEVLEMPVLPAQVLSLGIVAAFSYFGHLWFSFRRK